VLFPTGLLNAPELGAKLIRLQSLFSLTGIAQLVSRIPLILAPVMLCSPLGHGISRPPV